jgi:hypothetical protein
MSAERATRNVGRTRTHVEQGGDELRVVVAQREVQRAGVAPSLGVCLVGRLVVCVCGWLVGLVAWLRVWLVGLVVWLVGWFGCVCVCVCLCGWVRGWEAASLCWGR